MKSRLRLVELAARIERLAWDNPGDDPRWEPDPDGPSPWALRVEKFLSKNVDKLKKSLLLFRGILEDPRYYSDDTHPGDVSGPNALDDMLKLDKLMILFMKWYNAVPAGYRKGLLMRIVELGKPKGWKYDTTIVVPYVMQHSPVLYNKNTDTGFKWPTLEPPTSPFNDADD